MSRVVSLAHEKVAVYILTLGNPQRLGALQRWCECFGVNDLRPLLFRGINGRERWGKKENGGRWSKGVWKQMVRAGIVQSLSGPALRNLTPAEVAVALGFLCIFRDAWESGHARILVLEDDANFEATDIRDRKITTTQAIQGASCVARRLQMVLENPLCKKADVIRLGGFFTQGWKPCVQLGNDNETLWIGQAESSLGNHATLISHRACGVFLRRCLPLTTTIDHQMALCGARSPELIRYEVLPHFIGQDFVTRPNDSSIGYSAAERWILEWFWRKNKSPSQAAARFVRVKTQLVDLLPLLPQANQVCPLAIFG